MTFIFYLYLALTNEVSPLTTQNLPIMADETGGPPGSIPLISTDVEMEEGKL